MSSKSTLKIKAFWLLQQDQRHSLISRPMSPYTLLGEVAGYYQICVLKLIILGKAIETKSNLANSVFLLRFTSKVTHVYLSTGFIYCPSKRVSLLSPYYSSPTELFTNSVFRSSWCWFSVPLLPPFHQS